MKPRDDPVSPLDPASSVAVEWEMSSGEVARRWREELGLEVGVEFAGIDRFRLCRCQRSRLGFFVPSAPGGPSFYAQLQRQPWYYRGGKWEHAFGCAQVGRGARVLDVGCGHGEFVAAAVAAGFRAEGIDFNREAVDAARARGLAVSVATLGEVAVREEGGFDLVTAFQVLEHMPEPLRFLRECLALVRPSGRLLLAVPDSSGWLSRTASLLELPPHHATQWNGAAFQFLTRLLPMDLEQLAVEPMDPAHLGDYAASQFTPRLPGDPLGRRPLAGRAMAWMAAGLLRATGRYRMLPGISLVALFQRRP